MASSPTLAACLIVRDGARTLGRLLASVRPFVDEFCVVDFGSTDGTLELLEQAAGEPGAPIRVAVAAWRDDYAWARNESFAMASSEFVSWWDDDDVLEGGRRLRKLLAGRPDVVFVRRVEVRSAAAVSFGFGPRIVRRDIGARWEQPVHEYLRFPLSVSVTVVPPDDVRVLHHPQRSPRRHCHRELIERAYAEAPSRRLLSYLAREHAADGSFLKAASMLERVLNPADPLPPRERSGPWLEAGDVGDLRTLGRCYRELGRRGDAQRAFRTADQLANELRRLCPFHARTAAFDRLCRVDASDSSVWALADQGVLSGARS